MELRPEGLPETLDSGVRPASRNPFLKSGNNLSKRSRTKNLIPFWLRRNWSDEAHNVTWRTQHNKTTYQLLVRFHQEIPAFVHDPNPLTPINQRIALFLDLLNGAPSLNRDHEPGNESAPEPAWCIGHLVVPAHCADASAIV